MRWRVAIAGGLALLAGATVVAERVVPATAPQLGGFTRAVPYDGKFMFVRMYYDLDLAFGGGGGRGFGRLPPWAHDYPDGERHFMRLLTAITNVSAHVEESSVLDFSDPEMFKFPVIYLIEPGFWAPSDVQVKALRQYLDKGGFMIVDDFPYRAWDNFAFQMARVYPEGQWQDLDLAHPIFHTFFEVTTLEMPTAYNLGDHPIFRALYEGNDPKRRMQVIANYQNDLSEFWEYSNTGEYAVSETNEAYKVGINEFMFGITH
jgi:hypothetical protein